jgi:inositol-1,3,4-trisphosphate 5/6-kinase/inositol-tetrakisphosphate 1-kinase
VSNLHRVEDAVDQAPFSYPIIVKPLPAAGTKASHHMLVVLNRHGLRRVQFPCILQEYANHNGTLYKVYVLGDAVRVFPRNSLPNLPRGERLCSAREQQDHPGYVKFDSQRPYPKLSDFGVKDVHPWQKADTDSVYSGPSTAEGGSCAGASAAYTHGPGPAKRRRVAMQDTAQQREKEEQCSSKVANAKLVTADEIRPIATALRKAFNLELFGFDILVTQDDEDAERERVEEGKTMLVVDVNYFPSYKEMSNFPNMLAQYLTQRAVEGRMGSYSSSR